ncbi:MAG: EamA family transporter RarD [Acidobacteria bacterium]|nr:EamA family transporter RarD [Acidobacteriota bacterium]
MSESRVSAAGVLYAIGAYGAWGVSPLYWKLLSDLPALEILAFRVLWGMVLLFLLLRWRGRVGELVRSFQSGRLLRIFALSAFLIGINWYLYLYAVLQGHILQASLGYFINPLFNVLLGMLFLHERLRPAQWLAVGLAAVAVAQLAAQAGTFPWISLTLVLTFGIYGLVRKTAPADALLGMNLETAFLVPVAGSYVCLLAARGEARFVEADTSLLVLVAFTGVMTALPLLWFSNAARRLPLSTLGFFQYIAPTGQFLLAVFHYHEPFSALQLRSFVLIWIALAIFSFEAHRHHRRIRRLRMAARSPL